MSSRGYPEVAREDDRYPGRDDSIRSSRDDRGHRPSRRDYDDDRYRRDDRYGNRYDDARRSGGPRYEDDRRRRDDDYRPMREDRRDDRRGRDRGRAGSSGFRDDAPTPDRRSPTPPGAVPLSKRPRKASGWDLHAPGYEQYTALQAKATGLFNLPGANRAQPAPGSVPPPADAPVPAAPVYFPQAAAFGGGGNPNLARQSRRLYVGGITYSANEENISSFFNAKMVETGLGTNGPGDAVVAVQVNHEKSYAFVEFRSSEDATAAMAFDGIIFQGVPLKIRRPKDYAGPDPVAPSGFHVPGVVSTNVPDSANKIFVGGLPTYLNEEQVMELLKSFGELKAFNLVKDSTTGTSKGFAFFEYVDPSVTDIATQGLNGMELGDRFLVVQRASVGAKQVTGMPGMPTAEEYQTALTGRRTVIPRALDLTETNSRILLMLNMVTNDDLSSDEDYNDIFEDIREECGSYGPVEDLRIPRPAKREKKWSADGAAQAAFQRQADEDAGVGRVYVKFVDADSAGKALASLAGRAFAGRSIVATLLADDADTSPPLDVIFAPPAGEEPPPPPPPPPTDDAPPAPPDAYMF